MAQEVKFKRKTTNEIDNLEIEDGSLIYNVENGKTYMDYGNNRIPTGGGANGGIYVGDTEPTDPDITLWVDTPITETKASEIVNEYTESDTVGYSCDYINSMDIYSTDEVKTNKVWLGKPVYRKVIDFGALPNNTTKKIAHNINNIGQVIKLEGIATRNDDVYIMNIPNVATTSANLNIQSQLYMENKQYIAIYVASDRSAYNGIITLEYTKTTD